MKNFNKNIIVSMLAFALMLGFTTPTTVKAATTPSLGMAGTYGVLAGTFTHNIANTVITGDVGYTTSSGGSTFSVIAGTDFGSGAPTPQARIDTATALTNLDGQLCTFTFAAGAINLSTDTTHGTAGVYTPGVYCTQGAGAASIGTAGITLSGAGTYIFRINGALTSVNNSIVSLTNGASSCDVFWTPTAATTLGANTTFIGTLIDNANAITLGNLTSWTGRALSLGAGTITTDTNTITSTCSVAPLSFSGGISTGAINIVKVVINNNGGTKTINSFPLFVNGMSVVSGVTNIFPATNYYIVTETNDSLYTRTFSGDCDVNGGINLYPGLGAFCIITNDDIGSSAVVPPLIEVLKTASPLSLPAGSGQVVYTYTVRNIGTVSMNNVTLVGDTCSPIVLVSGDTNNDGKLDVNETWVNKCTTILSATHTNTVVATGWANGISATDIASATVVVGVAIVPPLIHIVKKPNLFVVPVGGLVTYMYTVTNPGIVPLSNVIVTDDKCTGLPGRVVGHPGDLNKNNFLESNEVWSFTCKTKLTQTTTNIGTARGSANGLTARDFAIATVVVATPKLPNTGFPPKENNILVILTGIFVASFVFYLIGKRKVV